MAVASTSLACPQFCGLRQISCHKLENSLSFSTNQSLFPQCQCSNKVSRPVVAMALREGAGAAPKMQPENGFATYFFLLLINLMLLFLFSSSGMHMDMDMDMDMPQSSSTIVETLPGYDGSLPFKLQTGYIGVGEAEEVQLFYYFIESESDPVNDPLILWLIGGPGCSGLSALFYEIGPLQFDLEAYDGGFPSLLLKPYSWTKVANIIFLDSPAGTGFSYSNTLKGYHSSDTKTIQDLYTFLQKWLLKHPKFLKNDLYISGDSYAGIWIPMLSFIISQGIHDGQFIYR